jgi:hypothetical protein
MYLNFIAGMKQRGSIGATISDLNNRYHEKYFLIDAENPAAGFSTIAVTSFRCNGRGFWKKPAKISLFSSETYDLKTPLVYNTRCARRTPICSSSFMHLS